jgi:II/X family phage/plasmid replication protein
VTVLIDTIGLKIPISKDSYEFLLQQMTVTQRIDKTTGEIEFEYHNSKLDFSCPSWNHKVMFKATDEYWTYDETSRRPIQVNGQPHIVLEFSIPKILFGHNLVSASTCLIYSALYSVRDNFERVYGILLPMPDDWYCYRLDTCANFILSDERQGRSLISYLQRLNYPRKPKAIYEDTGLYFPSRHHTLKIYLKGPEFKKHDLHRFNNKKKVAEYLYLAQKEVRVEVEHRKSLRYITGKYQAAHGIKLDTFEGYPCMADLIDMFDFEGEMKRIMGKVFCGTVSKVMKTMDAYNLLRQKHSEKQSRSFHHVYMVIITHGQKEAKKIIPEGTYYRALRAFRDVGLSLIVLDGTEEGLCLDRGFPTDISLEIEETNSYYQKPLYEYPPVHIEGEEEPF